MTDQDTEERRAAAWEADAAQSRAETIERLKFQVGFADSALKALMAANGGSLVALFAFFGNLAGKSGTAFQFNVSLLWFAFAAFALGLAATLIASLGAFMSQGMYYELALREAEMFRDMAINRSKDRPTPDPRDGPHKAGRRFELLGILAAIGSLALFVIGAALALASALPHHP